MNNNLVEYNNSQPVSNRINRVNQNNSSLSKGSNERNFSYSERIKQAVNKYLQTNPCSLANSLLPDTAKETLTSPNLDHLITQRASHDLVKRKTQRKVIKIAENKLKMSNHMKYFSLLQTYNIKCDIDPKMMKYIRSKNHSAISPKNYSGSPKAKKPYRNNHLMKSEQT